MGHGNHLSYHTHLTSKAFKLGSILDILYHPLHNLFWSKCASSHWWYTIPEDTAQPCVCCYVWFFVAPWTVACQVPLPMEFSRQDYWKVKVKVTQSCPTLCDPTDYTVHGILQARILEWVAFPFSRRSSLPKDQTQVSRMQEDSLPAEQGKPKNTGAGSLSLLHWVFPTQESNWDLLHCRQILYQLSYEGRILEWGSHFLLQRIEPKALVSPALAGGFFTTSATCEAPTQVNLYLAAILNMWITVTTGTLWCKLRNILKWEKHY